MRCTIISMPDLLCLRLAAYRFSLIVWGWLGGYERAVAVPTSFIFVSFLSLMFFYSCIRYANLHANARRVSDPIGSALPSFLGCWRSNEKRPRTYLRSCFSHGICFIVMFWIPSHVSLRHRDLRYYVDSTLSRSYHARQKALASICTCNIFDNMLWLSQRFYITSAA